jgi:hypothetical protein
MTQLFCDFRNFVLRMRAQLRFGRMSRGPLQLLRLEWRPDCVECDWLCRPLDDWDADLSEQSRVVNTSLQALEDAIEVRDLLFCAFPDIPSAVFRVYRELAEEPRHLIIAGRVTKPEPVFRNVHSLVMRAKLSGLHFSLEKGNLQELTWEEQDAGPQTREIEIHPYPVRLLKKTYS